MNIRKWWLRLPGVALLTGRGAKPDSATEALDEGIVFLDAGDLDSAIVAFTEAIQINPGFADAYNLRGWAYKEKDELDRAIADLDEAIRLKPEDALAYNRRGLVYEMKGEIDQAALPSWLRASSKD